MSNAKTGLWSAIGALAGGLVGAFAGKTIAQSRPRVRYAYTDANEGLSAPPEHQRHERRRSGASGGEIEDAMVIGGAGGAVLGAFIAGAWSGEEAPTTTQAQPTALTTSAPKAGAFS